MALSEDEPASFEEKIFYRLAYHLDSVFSMSGLRAYKAKFATEWHPIYLVRGRSTNWLRFMRAFSELTELPENHQPLLSRENLRQFWQIASGIVYGMRRTRKAKGQAKKVKPKRIFGRS